MTPVPSHKTTERTATLIREWVATVDRAAGPKPMALPFLAAGDPVALAGIALRTISEGILADRMGLARLALLVGATAEHAAPGRPRAAWGPEAQVRVGLALIDCAMRATGGFSFATEPYGSSRASIALGPRLVLKVNPGAMDAVRHLLGPAVPEAESYRPTIRDLAPPYRAIRTIMGGLSVTVALAETADPDLPGGDIELARAVPAGRA